MSVLGFSEARHLVSRTGFSTEWNEVNRASKLSSDQVINSLLQQNNRRTPAVPTLSSWARTKGLANNPARRKMVKRTARQEGQRLQTWWIKHLLTTRTPFLEHMTLFWHNHFPSSISKTKQAHFLYQQNTLFRQQALGNFGVLLRAVAKDPAMLLYLDGYSNTKEKPNENFSHEILELFTLGRGHYTQSDIQNAARAFTGWTINSQGKFTMDTTQHDTGVKTFLGQKGRFNGDDIINILLKHPRTAETIAEKMWLEFINTTQPNKSTIKQWAGVFRNSNYSIKQLLRAVLTSKAFWSQHNRGALIKSPIHLAVGTLRTLPYKLPRQGIEHHLNILGQGVFQHPSVNGWAGGKNWITTQSILLRASLLNNISGARLNPYGDIARQLPKASGERLQQWLLATKPLNSIDLTQEKQRLVHQLILDPAYQVY
ncbi:MAG: DUF1800 domain-containing protein [Cocleimonas sp.]|nr:DUF1800 domain-containing protein [Cocleimonas sp.]